MRPWRVSVIVPIKDEADNLEPLAERLRQALHSRWRTYEIVFIDDGSTDASPTVLKEMAATDVKVKVVEFSSNVGQAAALRAGIDHASGSIIVTLDGDLQNDPADIPLLLAKLEEGYDVVFGERTRRQDSLLSRRLPSRVANWLIRFVTGVPIRDMGCTLRAMRRELALSLRLSGGLHRFVPVLAAHQGARMAQVAVRHHPRVAGRSKYGLGRCWAVLRDLFCVQFLRSHLQRPGPRPYRVRATINLENGRASARKPEAAEIPLTPGPSPTKTGEGGATTPLCLAESS